MGVCLRHIGPREGKTGGGQTGERLRNPFLLAHGQRDLAEQRVTTVGESLIEAPTELEAVAMLRSDAVAKEQTPCGLSEQQNWPMRWFRDEIRECYARSQPEASP